ncbi:V-type ATPase subunit [Streptomyces sp. XD-27]|uniref:V-type ATPase subunit n=1 Tax=Streptomyces sp. XD-27 TaxID=3062779 RepID=UPI0026F45CE1|nr:V-type ATPase subunit [Streptomyces sp. XD-27]WKX69018.1 hypothetical protein Q3Y56_03000 [Streptomyces sp. XD-27]
MARFRDFLMRFRPMVPPGPAAPGGVPADRSAELRAELEPPLSLLEQAEAEAERVRAEAAEEAARRRVDAERRAVEIIAHARSSEPAVRVENADEVRHLAEAQAAELRTAAEREAAAIRRRAVERMPALVDRAVALATDVAGPGTVGPREGPRRECRIRERSVRVSAGWVAGVTRARAMLSRCAGAEGVREVAAAPTLDDALRYLAGTAYRHDLDPQVSPAQAQRAVGAALLWHLRVLAGWQPRRGADVVRLLAAGFEIANTEGHLRALSDAESAEPARPYRLGALSTAWPRLARTRSPAELRAVLATSAWGDPGGDTPAAVATGMRVSASVRTAAAVPEAARWAAGRLALLVARETFLLGRRMTRHAARGVARLLGPRAVEAASYPDFRQCLPDTARWALEGVDDVADLWRAEARWWERLERDGRDLLHVSRQSSAPVTGAVAVLSADAWRVRGALELAARGGGSWEAFDGPA